MFIKFTNGGTVVIDSNCIICAVPATQNEKNGSHITVMVGDHEKLLRVEESTEEIYEALTSIENEY